MPTLLLRRVSLLLAVGSLLASGCGKKEETTALGGAGPGRANANKAQAVEVVILEKRDLTESLNLVGSLAANESAAMRAEIGGIVRGIFFEEGQRVKAGDVLLKIDDQELRAQAAQIEARFNLARLNVERSESLSQSKTISQSEVDRSRSEFSVTEAELALIRLRLEKTEVRAPFDGVVGARSISPGDYVTPTSAITTIEDLSRLKISFQVPERYIGKVRPGTMARVKIRSAESGAEETVFSGEVYFVSSTIDRSVRASEVKAIIKDPTSQLRPGMFANIEVVLDTRKGVFCVPEGAILAGPRGIQIIAVQEKDGGKVANFVGVKTGLRTEGWVEVTPTESTLEEGTEVVAAGVGALILFPGAPVSPQPVRTRFEARHM
jgi:membrane fusion protein (multidrug efflux system)